MGHHRREDEQPIEGSAAESLTATEDVEAEAAAIASADDVWAQAQGYTPLRDLSGGSEEETVLYTDGSAVLMVGNTAFFAQAYDDDESDEGSSEHKQDDVVDFRSVADTALMGLENDYITTVSMQQNNQQSQLLVLLSQTAPPEISEEESNISDSEAPNRAEGPQFVADFDAAVTETMTPTTRKAPENKAELPEIDTDAVRRAVQNIQLHDPTLAAKCKDWEFQQKHAAAVAPRLHSIIPKQPLVAFRKSTNKAVSATNNLSRSTTLAEALRKLDILKTTKTTLRIHVVGCDHVECASSERAQTLLGPLVRWIGAHAEAPQHIYFHLIGPNVPTDSQQWSPMNLLMGQQSTISRLQSATLTCHTTIYETFLATTDPPDLAIAFNAGVWGYDEWKTTLEFLIQKNRHSESFPFVFTAYTLQEAEDDFDVIQEIAATAAEATTSNRCIWQVEANPFASKKDRATANAAPGRRYHENAAWQAWLL